VQIIPVGFVSGHVSNLSDALDTRLNPIRKSILKLGYEIRQQKFDLCVCGNDSTPEIDRLVHKVAMRLVGCFFHGETAHVISSWSLSRYHESPRYRDYQDRYRRGEHESNAALGRELHAKEREQQVIGIFGHGILLQKIPYQGYGEKIPATRKGFFRRSDTNECYLIESPTLL
jgi:hypothetical protein